jgi:hypothetical protein
VLVQLCSRAAAQRCSVILAQCCAGAVLPCCHVAVLRCCSVTAVIQLHSGGFSGFPLLDCCTHSLRLHMRIAPRQSVERYLSVLQSRQQVDTYFTVLNVAMITSFGDSRETGLSIFPINTFWQCSITGGTPKLHVHPRVWPKVPEAT